jgi:hypothetical protein
MNTDAAHSPFPVNNGDLLAHLGRADGGLLASRPTSNHHQVIFVAFHHWHIQNISGLRIVLLTAA